MALDLSDYLCGGYFLIKSSPRNPDRSPDLLPDRLISLSNCICASFQVYWTWGEQGHEEARAFGIPENKLSELAGHWQDTLSGEAHMPNVFYKLEAAQGFAAEFLPDKSQLHIVGIALPQTLVDGFLKDNQQTVYDTIKQTEEDIDYGVNAMLRDGESLVEGGRILGFEILSYSMQIAHSWLCSGLERDMHKLFGIRPNPHGLIDSLEEAMRVYAWIAEDEQKGQRAEPEPYYPWLLVDYPLLTVDS